MRRYTISVNDTTKVVDVEAIGADSFRVQLDGRLIDVRLDDHRDLAHSSITPGVERRAMATYGDTPSPAGMADVPAAPSAGSSPAAPARAAAAPAARPAAPARATAPAGGGGAGGKLTAPMPGVILSIDTSVGASVKRGDTLMILEAMKMKNELKAPADGVVAEIYASPNQQVKFGETLVRFEG